MTLVDPRDAANEISAMGHVLYAEIDPYTNGVRLGIGCRAPIGEDPCRKRPDGPCDAVRSIHSSDRGQS